MKKAFLILCMALGTLCVLANTTVDEHDDHVVINTATLNPGGEEVEVTVSLEGSRQYTSYQMDITLPEGWTIFQEEYEEDDQIMYEYAVYMSYDNSFYPSSGSGKNRQYKHSFSFSYGVVGDRVLRIACVPTSTSSFKANSGDLFTMTLVASPYAKPGNPSIQLTGVAFGTIIEGTTTAYYFDDAVSNDITVSTSATAPLVVGSALWSTCVLPFDATIPAGVTAYSCDRVEENTLYLVEAPSFTAYTPYILHADAAVNTSISGTVDPSGYPVTGYVSDAANLLQGAILPQSITAGYVLQKDPAESEPKFYDVNGVTFSIPEGKCWLTLPSGNSAPAIQMVIGDATSLKNLDKMSNGQIYNVLGMPVSHPLSGQVYIQNGQKFIQK